MSLPSLIRVFALALACCAAGVGGAQAKSSSPDYLMVNGVPHGDKLALRKSPDGNAKVVARLSNGVLVRNLGCVRRSQTWCEVRTVNGGASGWAAGRYLVESAPPGYRPPDTGNNERPQLSRIGTFQIQARWSNGCTMLYDFHGNRQKSYDQCSQSQRQRTDAYVAEWLRKGTGQRPQNQTGVRVPVEQMAGFCLANAAQRLGVARNRIEIYRTTRTDRGYAALGKIRDKKNSNFQCTFSSSRIFQGVFR